MGSYVLKSTEIQADLSKIQCAFKVSENGANFNVKNHKIEGKNNKRKPCSGSRWC